MKLFRYQSHVIIEIKHNINSILLLNGNDRDILCERFYVRLKNMNNTIA